MCALRSAAALLRGGAGLALAPQRVLAAGAGAQAAAELARRLGQGCAARHAATAAGGESGAPLRGAAAEAAVPRRQKAPNVGLRGEKTDDGRPKPDERTVADLVRRGWFESDEVLTIRKSGHNRFPFETAKLAADWLEATLGRVPLKGGVLPAAKAVNRFPALLLCDAATLQRKWDALTLPAEQGGVGIAFSEKQAREAVLKHPRILSYTTDTLQRGWLMLTATERGLGLSPEEARGRILFDPGVLRYRNDDVVRRVELLKSLGYPTAHEMVFSNSTVLGYSEASVREHAAWWKQTGLDHVKIVAGMPCLLGAPTTTELQKRLDFMRGVAGVSDAELNKAGVVLAYSFDRRLRARYFYALLKGRLARFGRTSTMMTVKDSIFLAKMQGQSSTARASDLEVARYKEHVASAKFVAWRERQEALLLAAKRP